MLADHPKLNPAYHPNPNPAHNPCFELASPHALILNQHLLTPNPNPNPNRNPNYIQVSLKSKPYTSGNVAVLVQTSCKNGAPLQSKSAAQGNDKTYVMDRQSMGSTPYPRPHSSPLTLTTHPLGTSARTTRTTPTKKPNPWLS